MPNDRTGGPAFPKQPVHHYPNGTAVVMEQGGMSLRDYFAAKAMQGLMVNPKAHLRDPGPHEISLLAFACADAMLKVRAS